MLSIYDGNQSLNRRSFLRAGSLGLGGLSLASLLSGNARAGASRGPLSGKSVIFIFQQGGPSQLETFDPKPEAPDSIRTLTDTISTSIPGVQFGSRMQRLAQIAHKFTVVRSFQTNNAGHNIQPMVGPDTAETNIGSFYSRMAGATRPENGTPTNAVLFPQSVCDDVTKGKARGDLSATGELGAAYAPFVPGAGGQLQKDMTLNLSRDRFDNRQDILRQLNDASEQIGAASELGIIDDLQAQAYQVLFTGGVANALDLSREDPSVLAEYDTSRFVAKHHWKRANRGKSGFYTGHAKSFGKLLLLARRLCEAGSGFVTVHAGYDGVWDMHADRNNLNVVDGMEAVGQTFDHAVATLINDIEARGLTEKILVVACGEMGRTPRINKNGGRDHWSRLAPLLLSGGGIKNGQVIGQSTRDAGEPATDNLTVQHLLSTIMHTLFDTAELRVTGGVPQQVADLSASAPIPELF